MRRPLRTRRVLCDGSESGFTLVEVSVALFILAVALLAMVAAGFGAMRAAATSRTNTQASDLLNAEIERVRSLDYSAVTLTSTDATLLADPAIDRSSLPWRYNGERLDHSTAGGLAPQSRSVQATIVDNVIYTIRRYVTVPSGTPNNLMGLPSVRRFTAVVSWKMAGHQRTRSSSTMVTFTRRGLPLPQYRFDYYGAGTAMSGTWTISKAPGAQADFGLRLVNLGARDAWTIAASNPGWLFYVDTDKNGVWSGDTTTEPLLSDSSGDGQPDTGLIEPSSPPFYVVASRAVGMAETGAESVTFSATSVAQPSVAAKTVDGSVQITTSPTPTPTGTATPTPTATPTVSTCTPGTANFSGSPSMVAGTPPTKFSNTSLKLFNGNGTIDGDSTTQAISTMGTSGASAPGACNYSTEAQTGVAGRLVTPSSSSRWEYGATASTDEYKGSALATVWTQCPSGGPGTTLTFKVYSRENGVDTLRGMQTASLTSSCGSTNFQPVQALVYVGTATGNNPAWGINANSADRLVLVLETNRDVRVLYEAPGADSSLIIPAK